MDFHFSYVYSLWAHLNSKEDGYRQLGDRAERQGKTKDCLGKVSYHLQHKWTPTIPGARGISQGLNAKTGGRNCMAAAVHIRAWDRKRERSNGDYWFRSKSRQKTWFNHNNLPERVLKQEDCSWMDLLCCRTQDCLCILHIKEILTPTTNKPEVLQILS